MIEKDRQVKNDSHEQNSPQVLDQLSAQTRT